MVDGWREILLPEEEAIHCLLLRDGGRGGALLKAQGDGTDAVGVGDADADVVGGAEGLGLPTEVREPEQVDALVEAAIERFGSIDVLVNNAGGQFIAKAEDISPNGWRAVHRFAVDAAWDVTRTVAERSMIPNRDGVVVFIGFSPRRGMAEMAHAASARAAIGYPVLILNRPEKSGAGHTAVTRSS